MPSFSFTAPFVSEDQEERERSALTESQKRRLQRDVRGGGGEGSEPAETDETLRLGTGRMREILLRYRHPGGGEYREALERVPELVSRESDLVAFLRGSDYDVGAAAKKVAEYWEVRKSIFGPDRAFLPMTQEGAVADDMDDLRRGLVQILPDDLHGRPVVYFNRVGVNIPGLSRDTVARLLFYHLQIVSERVDAQKHGFVYLVNMKGFDMYKNFDRLLTKTAFRVSYALPARFCSAHCYSGPGLSVVRVIFPVIKHVGGHYFRMRAVLHAGSDSEIAEGLASYGVVGDRVKDAVEGKRTDAYGIWISDRGTEEKRRESAAG